MIRIIAIVAMENDTLIAIIIFFLTNSFNSFFIFDTRFPVQKNPHWNYNVVANLVLILQKFRLRKWLPVNWCQKFLNSWICTQKVNGQCCFIAFIVLFYFNNEVFSIIMSSAPKQSTGTVPKANKAEKKVEKSLERRPNTGQHINVSAGLYSTLLILNSEALL